MSREKTRFAGYRCIALLLLGLLLAWNDLRAEAKLTFLDAGQGDSSVIQIDQPTGEPFTIVIDGGTSDKILKNNLPLLLANDPTIELMVLTHLHADHTGALDWLVISKFQIKQVWWTGEIYKESNYSRLQSRIAEKGIAAKRPDEGIVSFTGFNNFKIRVLNNGNEFAGTSGADINNDSIVFQLIYSPKPSIQTTALFTGDIEGEQGKLLIQQYGDQLRSDLIKVPHHGSDHLFREFPGRIGAKFAIVSSSGTNKTFKHPRKQALDLYARYGSIYCTCDAKKKIENITAAISDEGIINVSPAPAPYFAWVESNGKVKRIVVH